MPAYSRKWLCVGICFTLKEQFISLDRAVKEKTDIYYTERTFVANKMAIYTACPVSSFKKTADSFCRAVINRLK